MSNNPSDNTQSQTALLLVFLLQGKKFHCKLPERQRMGIGYPPSRIHDLNKKFGLREFIHRDKDHESPNQNGHVAKCHVHFIPREKIAAARLSVMTNHPKFYQKVKFLEGK